MLRELLAIALGQISAGKGRSFLTVLGILIGIATIILITTVLESYSRSITEDLSDLGANTFQLQRYEGGGFNRRERDFRPPVKREIRDFLYEQCPSVLLVGAEYWHFGAVIQFRDEKTNPNVQVMGGTPEFAPNNAFNIAAGRNLSEDDVRSASRVVVLATDVLEEIFPGSIDPLGQEVRIDGHTFTVIGQFHEKKAVTFGGSKNNLVGIPITTFAKLYGESNRSTNVTIQARSAARFAQAMEEVIGAARLFRKVPPGEENNFYIYSNDTVVAQFSETADMIKLIALAIGIIALIVGAVGVMNIMLVSVTERTREIGVRKALGAKRSLILSQFLLEAVLLSISGAILGIITGILLGVLSTIQLGLQVVIPVNYIIAGVFGTSLIGILAGIYPAWKASSLDPISALRYE
jgi:putative ABC transport system permease protein